MIAKQAATLDVLSGGRLILGAGVGWSAEEFAALGVPFAQRASRTKEYAASMRTIWREDVASFHGEFARFDAIRVNPKPMAGRANYPHRSRRQLRCGTAAGGRVG